MTTKVIMILIDAFAISYLSEKITPFLYDLRNRGAVYSLEQLFAFRGIEATIFTGRYPEDHKVWTEFCLKQTEGPKNDRVKRLKNRIVGVSVNVADHIPSDRLIRDYRYVTQKYFLRQGPASFNCIPANLLDVFEIAQAKPVDEPGAIGEFPTLFDVMRKYNTRFNYLAPPRFRTSNVLRDITRIIEKQRDCEFWYFKLDLLDPVGHAYGPRSDQLKHALSDIDEEIKTLFTVFTRAFNDVQFVILSDHGMSPVNRHFDLLNVLKKLPVKLREDYVFFLDSTMARFWFSNEQSRDAISHALSGIDCGTIVGVDDLEAQHLGRIDDRYGQLVFALKEGWALHPDFFHKHSMQKGMHGYIEADDCPVALIYPSEGRQGAQGMAQMIDIMPTVCRILGIASPPGCKGRVLANS